MNLRKQKALLFGASKSARLAINSLKRTSIEIIAVFDNDTSKHGNPIGSLSVNSPTRLLEFEFDIIIIASWYTTEIHKQLTEDFRISETLILVFNHFSMHLEPWTPPRCSETALQIPELEAMVESLPPLQRISLECGDIDSYGNRHQIASWLGIDHPPSANLNWMHGWRFYPLFDPKLLPIKAKSKEINLTNHEEEAIFLRQNGFPSSLAAGSPFLYAQPDKTIHRIPSSALLLSAHSTMENSRKIDQDALVQKNQPLLESFDTVAQCLGGHDALLTKKSNSKSELTIPWITGAWFTDKNALKRIWILFSSFETIITNHIGSHIPYALACGCNIKFCEPMYKIDRANLIEKEKIYRENPHFFDHVEPYTKLKNLKELFPQIFKSKKNQDQNAKIGKELLGVQNMKSKKQISEIFGWI